MSAAYWNPVSFLGRSAPNSLQQVLPRVCLPSRRILPARRTDPQRKCSVQFPSRDSPYLFPAPCFFQLSWCAGEGEMTAFISRHCQTVEFSRSLVSRACRKGTCRWAIVCPARLNGGNFPTCPFPLLFLWMTETVQKGSKAQWTWHISCAQSRLFLSAAIYAAGDWLLLRDLGSVFCDPELFKKQVLGCGFT